MLDASIKTRGGIYLPFLPQGFMRQSLINSKLPKVWTPGMIHFPGGIRMPMCPPGSGHGTPTDYFVDPNAGDDGTGDGSVGNPWATIQNALDTITRDSTNGDRINVQSTTDDVLGSALSLATYGTPAFGAPLVFQGYTSSQGDGGVGGISGNNSVHIFNAAGTDHIYFIDMHLHNTGSNDIFTLWCKCKFRSLYFWLSFP
jgi:hypothetical protein